MTIESASPSVAILYNLLIIAGLLCLVHHLFFKKQETEDLRGPFSLDPWKIKGLDMALIFIFVYLLVFGAGAISVEAYKFVFKTEEIAEAHEFLFGFPMHLAIIFSLLGFFKYFNLSEDVPLNPVRYGIFSLAGKAFYYFLAVLPLLMIGSFLWPFVLDFFNLPADPQDLVKQVDGMTFSPTFLLIVLLAVIIAPLSEEFLFRAFLYRGLKSYMSPNLSAVASSLVFACMHFNWLSLLPLFILGIWLCRSYEKSGNIWVPIILHGLFNGNTLLILTFLEA
jgi:membrane protease YdiL (CAAX protease family)